MTTPSALVPSALLALNRDVSGAKIVWGVAAITVNLGSRFIIGELTPMQQEFMRHPLVKRAVLLCLFFLPTRDILLSVCLAFVASLLLEFLLNERSDFCIVPSGIIARSLPVGHRAAWMGLAGGAIGRGPPEAAPSPEPALALTPAPVPTAEPPGPGGEPQGEPASPLELRAVQSN
jgi:hypothetical protein